MANAKERLRIAELEELLENRNAQVETLNEQLRDERYQCREFERRAKDSEQAAREGKAYRDEVLWLRKLVETRFLAEG